MLNLDQKTGANEKISVQKTILSFQLRRKIARKRSKIAIRAQRQRP
jgi:hypothetical protein